ncbi:MAG TPA: transaldolase [Planctomycetota bacterium]|nr:transaldolase [Planctomycetota bacterium]
MNKLIELSKLGQSVWYDNVERKLLKSGPPGKGEASEMKRLIAEDAVSGVTSNPSIFEKAITSSTDYDADIKALAKLGKNADEIYEAITIKDIVATCGLLDQTCKASGYCDGYVSIEVSPDYAYNTEQTLESGRRIFKTVNCPNVLIKVPGTPEGFVAVRQLIAEGISVNITLLFSQQDYINSANAYIEGLKERLKQGMPLNNVFSVASVFISRTDSAIDKMMEERGAYSVERTGKGKCAVANAKTIYQLYKNIFTNADFSALKAKGARAQKIVWASTSTKNPAYPDTLYVDELIGPETINTIPTATLFAFKDHGKPAITIDKNTVQAQNVLKALADNGINLEQVCAGIQKDGIKSFKDSYDKALKAIGEKLKN